jgi:hypothetical protein
MRNAAMALFILALLAPLTAGDTAVASPPAASVFPIANVACHTYPCAVDPYPAGSPKITRAVDADILPGIGRGLIQTQILTDGATTATVLYSAFNADKSYLQTLWITVLPSKGGYHVMLATCRGTDNPPCKV